MNRTSAPLTAATRLPLWVLVVAALCMTGLAAGFVAVLPGSTARVVGVRNAIIALAQGLVIVGCLHRWRREQGRARGAWQLLALGSALVAAGVLGMSLRGLVLGQPEQPRQFDALNLGGLVVFAVGLVRLYDDTFGKAGRWRSLGDATAASTGFLLLTWSLVVTDSDLSAAGVPASILYGYLALAAGLLTVTLQLAAHWQGDDRTVGLLAAGLAFDLLALVAIVVRGAHGVYLPGDPLTGVGVIGGSLLVLCAGLQNPGGGSLAARERRRRRVELLLPSATAALVFAIVVIHFFGGREPTDTEQLVGIMVLAYVIARLLLTLRENQALTWELGERVKARTAELERSRRHFRDVVQHSTDVIIVMSSVGDITYCSPAVERVLGYRPDEVLGRNATDLIHPGDVDRALQLRTALDRSEDIPVLSCRLRRADGSWLHAEAAAGRLSAPESEETYVVNVRDVSERAQFEEQLRYQANHDPLTGLANRTLLQDRVRHALLRSRRTQEPTALLYVDLDHFKRLNDSVGHTAGDEALVGVARVLERCVRPSDTAARLGGDEFAVLLEETSTTAAVAVAERIVAELHVLAQTVGRGAVTGASVGVAVATHPATDRESLLRDADIAMYQAKASGRGRFAVFHPAMREQLVQQLELEQALRWALETEGLRLHLQPIFDLDSGAVVALEALVRWLDPHGHFVPPSLFIPLAEEVGLIGEIDRWVVRQACQYVASLPLRCTQLAGVTLNVNVSATDLYDEPLADWLSEVLTESGLEPRQLVVEITETAVLPDPTRIVGPLQSLRDRGVRVSLDDFGTGYSSISTLRHVPLDEIKIDGSFVAGLDSGRSGVRLVSAILRMVQALELPVVAEAIESTEQARILRTLRCEYGQGWLFAPAMEPDELERWATRHYERPVLTVVDAVEG